MAKINKRPVSTGRKIPSTVKITPSYKKRPFKCGGKKNK